MKDNLLRTATFSGYSALVVFGHIWEGGLKSQVQNVEIIGAQKVGHIGQGVVKLRVCKWQVLFIPVSLLRFSCVLNVLLT